MARPANDNSAHYILPPQRGRTCLRIRYHSSREDLSFADIDAVAENDNRRRTIRTLLAGIAAEVSLALLCIALLITR